MFENKDQSFTPLSDLGEFGLIDHLTKYFKISKKSTIKSIGDDAAVLDLSEGQTVMTTDLLMDNIHFDLTFTPLKHLGYKAVMVNLSDVCAMNVFPTQITVSIAMSDRFSLEAMEDLYAGIQLACETYGVDLVGGDTTSSTQGLLISVTALGQGPKEKITYRNGAKPNDLLVVTGDLGAAYMGLQVLEREKEVFKVNPQSQPDLTPYDYLIERQLKPEARKDIVELLDKLKVKPTAMIDISDGLSSEILHLCKQSHVGCKLFEDKIPLDQQVITACEEFNLNSTTIALSGGEDYELLMTISQNDYDKIKGNPNLSVIGFMTEPSEEPHLVTRAGQSVALTAQGWKSF